MMVRGALQGISLSSNLETAICTEFYSRHFGIVPVISLAGYLAREGLDVEAYHQRKELFWAPLRRDTIGFKVQTYRYEQAVSYGVKLFEPVDLDVLFLKKQLESHKLVICGTTHRPSGIRHAVLLHSSIGSCMQTIDPLEGKVSLESGDFLDSMQTFAGQWCISVGK